MSDKEIARNVDVGRIIDLLQEAQGIASDRWLEEPIESPLWNALDDVRDHLSKAVDLIWDFQGPES